MKLEPTSPRRPLGDATRIHPLKDRGRAALSVEEDILIAASEPRCAELGCPDVETVIGLLAAGQPPPRSRLLKPLAEITAADLAELAAPDKPAHWP